MIRVIEGAGHDRMGALRRILGDEWNAAATLVFPTARQAYQGTPLIRPGRFPSFRSWLCSLVHEAGLPVPFSMDYDTTLRCAADFGLDVASMSKAEIAALQQAVPAEPGTPVAKWQAFCESKRLFPAQVFDSECARLLDGIDQSGKPTVVIMAGEDLDKGQINIIRELNEAGLHFLIYSAPEQCTLKFCGADPEYLRKVATDWQVDEYRSVRAFSGNPDVAVWTHASKAPIGFATFDKEYFQGARRVAEIDVVQAAAMVVCGCDAEPWLSHELQRPWCWAAHDADEPVRTLWEEIAPQTVEFAIIRWPHLLRLSIRDFCAHIGGGIPNQDLLPWLLPHHWSANVWTAKGVYVGPTFVQWYGYGALPKAIASAMMAGVRE